MNKTFKHMTPLLSHSRRPDITFRRDGCIQISARVARLLHLAAGDSINVAVHDSEHLLYAIPAGRGHYEARCRPTKRGSLNLAANSVRLCRAMLALCPTDTLRVAYPAGEPLTMGGTTYLPIITRNPLKIKQR